MYEANFNNVAANDLKYSLATAGSFAGVAALFPPMGALDTLTGIYLGLLATRIDANKIDANNKGNGIYIGITWAAVFNVEPL